MIRIFIPSAGRAQDVRTLASLRGCWGSTSVVVPEAQGEAYRAELPPEVAVLTHNVDRIRATRQWIVNYALENGIRRIVMVDDDLRFRHRAADSNSHVRVDDASGLVADLELVMDEGFVHVGVADEFMCQHRPRGYSVSQRYNQVLAYDLDRIVSRMGAVPEYRTEINEEHDVHLQLAEKGLPPAVLNDWTKSSRAYSTGGCSTWRTAEVEKQGHFDLAQLHPKLVRVVENPKALSGFSIRVRWGAAKSAT